MVEDASTLQSAGSPSSATRTSDQVEPWFSQKTRVQLGIVSFVFATAVFLYGVVAPQRFEHPMARGALLIAVGLYSAVFWFVMWPQNLELNNKVLTLGTRIAGPVALMIILIVLYNRFLPADYAYGGEVFRIKPTNDAGNILYIHGGTRLDYRGDWYPVPDPKNPALLLGLYVHFPRGSNEVTAELTLFNCKPKVVTFRRGAGEVVLEVERVP